jgi:TRAP-type transport system periplasmic protein
MPLPLLSPASARRSVIRLAALPLLAALLLPAASSAQTKLDISIPWGPGEFHSINAGRFAERVKAETQGSVQLNPQPGGTLGVKANESLRALADGVVPMAEYALFQNASRGAVLSVETLPFLVGDYEQLKLLHKNFRPVWEALLLKNNQKALYVVPWPNQFFFTKKAVASLDDLKGVKMRSLDKLTTDWINRLGMVPVQMTNLEILQALGAGMIEGVPTSAGTAVAQKYWDFMKFGYQTNHIWASNVMAVNLDARTRGARDGAAVLGSEHGRPPEEGRRPARQRHGGRQCTEGAGRRDGQAHLAAVGRVHETDGRRGDQGARRLPQGCRPLSRSV